MRELSTITNFCVNTASHLGISAFALGTATLSLLMARKVSLFKFTDNGHFRSDLSLWKLLAINITSFTLVIFSGLTIYTACMRLFSAVEFTKSGLLFMECLSRLLKGSFCLGTIETVIEKITAEKLANTLKEMNSIRSALRNRVILTREQIASYNDRRLSLGIRKAGLEGLLAGLSLAPLI